MKKLGFICLLILNYTISNAQWTQTNGPEGGYFNSMEKVGNSIWAAMRSGIYTSQNDGASWTKLPFLNDACLDIKCHGDTIVILCTSIPTLQVTTYDLYSRKSTDGGLSFSTATIIESSSSSITYPPQLFNVNNKYFTKGQWDWYISDNNGITWTLYPLPFGNAMSVIDGKDSIIFLEFKDNIPGAAGIYSSTDMINFSLVDTTYSASSGGLMVDNSLFLYISDYDTIIHQYVIKSDNFGTSWDTVYSSGPLAHASAGCSNFNGGIYFYQYPNYIFSNDKGQTWNTFTFPTGYSPSPLNNNLLLSNGDILNYVYPAGIVRYIPSQNIYFPTQTGIKGQYPISLSSNKGNLYCGTLSNSFMSSDAGSTWQKIPADIKYVVDFAFCGDTIIGAQEDYNGHLIRSFNNGANWDTLSAPVGLGWYSPTSIEFIGSTLYSSSDRILSSNDLGITWDTLPKWTTSGVGNCITTGSDLNGYVANITGQLWVVTNDGDVLKYDTTSQTWSEMFCFWSTGSNNSNKMYSLGSSIIVTGSAGMFISNDAGLTWNGFAPSSMPVTTAYNFMSVNNVWAASCGSYGIYFSSDYGITWSPLQTPSPFYARGGLTALNGKLFCGSYYNSVWARSGTLETISGVVFNDQNNNNVQDAGEKGIKNIVLKLKTSGLFATTDSLGHYVLTYDVTGDTLETELPFFCNTFPAYYISPGTSVQNFDFAVTFNTTIGDFSVDLSNINIFRPGFQTNLMLSVKNQGTISQPSVVDVTLDPQLQFNSATPSPTSITGNQLSWDVDSLEFNTGIGITINVNTPIAANLGSAISCIASVTPSVIDTFPSNNTYVLNDSVRGSFDPNDKQCLQGNYFTPQQLQNGEALEFIVRFQNTGNFPASVIHIIDTLSQFLDVSTFQVVSSSHPVEWSITGQGRVEFIFDNINLPASSFDEPNSHGLVKYTVRCKKGLSIGNAIVNTAYIYFDFNTPIITNTTTTLIANPVILVVNNNSGISNYELLLYPNPASNILNIVLADNPQKYCTIRINSNITQVYSTTTLNKYNQLDISNFADGFYYGTLVNEKGELLKGFKFVIRH